MKDRSGDVSGDAIPRLARKAVDARLTEAIRRDLLLTLQFY